MRSDRAQEREGGGLLEGDDEEEQPVTSGTTSRRAGRSPGRTGAPGIRRRLLRGARAGNASASALASLIRVASAAAETPDRANARALGRTAPRGVRSAHGADVVGQRTNRVGVTCSWASSAADDGQQRPRVPPAPIAGHGRRRVVGLLPTASRARAADACAERVGARGRPGRNRSPPSPNRRSCC